MNSPRLPRSLVAGAIGVALLGSTGCMSLLRGVAREYAPGSSPAEGPGAPPRELTPDQAAPDDLALAASRPAAAEVQSDYQSAPTIDWKLYRFGAPFSVSRALFERRTPMGPTCQPAPLGAWSDFRSRFARDRRAAHLNRYGTSATRPIADTGRFERDLAFGDVGLGALFLGDRNALAARYIASAARLGHQGHACSESLSITVWWSSDGTDVTLLR